MFSHDTRAQVLANLKFLYGPEVEVITLNFDTLEPKEPEKYQAVAVKFNPTNNATWTKYLHGEPSSASNYATLNLLRESEKELTKLFSANGNVVPFKGDMAQTSTMGHGQREGSSAEGSLQSDFVFVDTVEPTFPDGTVPKDLIEEESPIQKYPVPATPVEEAIPEPADEAPRAVTAGPGPFCDEPEPASGNVETRISGWSSWSTSKNGWRKQNEVLTFDLPALVEEHPAKASVEEPPAEVETYTVECIVEQSPPSELEPVESIVEESPVREPEPVEETELEGGPLSLKKKQKRGKKSNQGLLWTFDEPITELESAPELEPAIEDAWGTSGVTAKKSKKKKGGMKSGCVDMAAEASHPPPEPEPVIDDTYFGWGTTNKKSKKKKGGSTFESVDPVAEALPPSPEPEPEPEPFIEDIWGTWELSTKKSKKSKGGHSFGSAGPVDEVPPLPSEPEPIIEDTWFGWGTTNKKGKKMKGKSLEVSSHPAPEPEFDPVVVDTPETPTKKEEKMRSALEPEPDEWAQFSASKRSENDERGVPKMPLEEESPATKELSAEMLEVPPASEPVKHADVAILLPKASSTETATHTIQPSAPRSGQTVVFTIQFPDEINLKPLQAMITLADNTRAAILEAVHSYINSKSSFKFTQGWRRLEIRSGAGKNGDVDLSTLEEMMWPEYLEYFRQYTKLPELTVDCFHR